MNHDELRTYWDEKVALFLDGQDYMDHSLEEWRSAYDGVGHGRVVMSAFPEPYVGSIEAGVARGTVLGLNPGQAYLDFQAQGGIFADEIREMGSYSKWAASWPYLRDPWERLVGPNRYPRSRRRFLAQWTGVDGMPDQGLLTMELFPWHSKKVTASMKPDPGIVREFVTEPIVSLGHEVAFAFGAAWFPILERLAVEVVDRLGAGGRPYGTRVKSRSVLIVRLPGDLVVLAEKHSGGAGPPAVDETAKLMSAVEELGT